MKALLLVDIQNDFLPGGALAVPDGDKILPVVNRLIHDGGFDLIVVSQDWHPIDHTSFAANHPGKKVGDVVDVAGQKQTLWPVHCVQGEFGSEVSAELDLSNADHFVHKGIARDIDSYGTFYDNARRRETGLDGYLRSKGVEDIYVVGLATDYCVKFSVLDALQEGYRVHLVLDGCSGIDLHPGDCDAAVEEMRAAGAEVIESSDLVSS